MSSCQTADVERAAPELSIIIPVHNGALTLRACLEALLGAPGPARELIVVDDGSRDGSVEIAKSLGILTVQHDTNVGCNAARTSGVTRTSAPVLVFVDSDVVIHPNALQRIADFMSENKEYSAIFGSYDAAPGHPSLVSQYRNLLHHFTHQSASHEAETFWTGLGAVRRSVFWRVGGFRTDCLMGDIVLGLDLCDAGFRIRLDRELLGKHLKRWTVRSMVLTDIFQRALPWSEIILDRGRFTNDLNTSPLNRFGVLFANITFLCLAMTLLWPQFANIAAMTIVITIIANLSLFKRFFAQRGLFFSLGVVPLHFVHQLCSGIGFTLAFGRFGLLSYALPFSRKRLYQEKTAD